MCVVAIDSVPPSALRNSAEVRRMFCISRKMLLAREMISSPAGGDAGQRAALAFEQLKSEFLLEQLQLPADPRLRGVQLPGGGRDVQAVFVDRHEISQLLEFHVAAVGLCLRSSIGYARLTWNMDAPYSALMRMST